MGSEAGKGLYSGIENQGKPGKPGGRFRWLRGINRQTIFEDDEDINRFLHTLEKYGGVSGFKIYAYCLMGNHIHLLLKEGKEELGIIMRRMAGRSQADRPVVPISLRIEYQNNENMLIKENTLTCS